jgi:PAS domain-containing protein
MFAGLLTILWFLMPFCSLLAGLIAWSHIDPAGRWSFAALATLSLLCWTYLSARLIGFRIRLFKFLRLLLANDYEAGIRTRRRFSDEISRMEDLANRVAEQLQAYDTLRAARVSIHARSFDMLLDRSGEPLAAVDVQQEVFLLNPAAQQLLGIERKRFSFESVLKPDINKEFSDLFNDALLGRKILTEGFSWLQLPGMSDPVYIGVQFTPLRDRNEDVRFMLLSLKAPDAQKPQQTS